LLLLGGLLVFRGLEKAGVHVGPLSWFVPSVNGSFRWIRLPGVEIQVQPSEFLKVTYILALAGYLRYRRNYRRLSGLVGPFALTLLPILLILLEPDLGTSLLLLPVLLATLLAAGAKGRHVGAVVVLAALSLPGLFLIMEPYQRGRVIGMFLQYDRVRDWLAAHPDLKNKVYPQGDLERWYLNLEGYQLYHSKLAMGSGGVWGYGGQPGPYVAGSRRLPHCHNDFIFAMVGHQYGAVGVGVLLLLYAGLAVGLIEIASAVREPFGRLVAVGAGAMIATQCLINMAMTVGMLPITGLTLPFVSYGGSSLLTYFVLIGLALSVDRTRPISMAPQPFEFAAEEDD